MKNRSLSTVAGLSGSIALMLSGQVAHAQAEDIVVESVTVQGNVVSVHLGSSAEGSAIGSAEPRQIIIMPNNDTK